MRTYEPKRHRPLSKRRARTKAHHAIRLRRVQPVVEELLGEDLHAKRVLSIANGVLGVIHAAALGIHAIGRALAVAQQLDPKHAIKQVDRLVSNPAFDPWDLFRLWVPYVVAGRPEIVVALDWTEFDRDGQSTICAYLVTNHGRATPLVWKTVPKDELIDGGRTDCEDEVLLRLQQVLPSGVRPTILADRGFGDQKLYEFLDRIGWGYVIRFRQGITVTTKDGSSQSAAALIPKNRRAKMVRDVQVTSDKTPIGAVVVVHAPKMKDPWCLATNRMDLAAAGVVKLYGRRFTIEETFRDQKDPRFGLGINHVRIKNPARRDRLLFLSAIALVLLTLLGAAGEACGLDRILKANTSKKRQMSLFRQGCLLYELLPGMRPERLRLLMNAYGSILQQHDLLCHALGIV